jgi:hypothetical protein
MALQFMFHTKLMTRSWHKRRLAVAIDTCNVIVDCKVVPFPPFIHFC